VGIPLTIPPEPTAIKSQILETKANLSKNGHMVPDSFAFWYGNSLPSYLWSECGWKDLLSSSGFTWQKFLKFMSYATNDALSWVNGRMGWESLARKIIESINGHLGDAVRRGRGKRPSIS
jgi:hypothetical protein